MKNYKDKIINLGCSDIASLVARTVGNVGIINFGEDGNYGAYEVEGECEIPSHYEKVFSGNTWLCIYDDLGVVYDKTGKYDEKVDIYRAGDYGCIIHWHD